MAREASPVKKFLFRLAATAMAAVLVFGAAPPAALAVTANNNSFTSNTIPSSMYAGQRYSVRITVKNTGSATWTAVAGYKLLCTAGASTFGNYTSYRLPATVKPGYSVSFTLTMTAPMKKGRFTTSWRMCKGTTKFGPTLTKYVSVTIPVNNSLLVSATAPTTVRSSQSYALTATFKNIGSARWTRAGKYQLFVYVKYTHDYYPWSTSSSSIPLSTSDSIAFGASKKFTLTNRKTLEGDYTYTFQMMCNGRRFGAAVTKKVHLAYSTSQILTIAQNLTATAESTPSQANVDAAQYWVSRLPDGPDRTGLQSRLDAVLRGMDADTNNFVALNMLVIGNGDEPDKDLVLQAVNNHIQPLINASIDLQTIPWSDYNDRIALLMASGDDSADIVFTASWAADYPRYSAFGCYHELTELLNDHGQDILSACGQDYLEGVKINGGLYAVPANREKAHSYGPLLLKSVVDKFSIDVSSLHTWSDLTPWFDQIKADPELGGMYPVLAVPNSPSSLFKSLDWDYMHFNNTTPGALDPATEETDSTVVNNYTAQKSVDMYKMMRNWYDAGYINPDNIAEYDDFSLMRTGNYFCVSALLLPGTDTRMSAATGQQWVQVPFTSPVMSNRETLNSLMALPATGKHPIRSTMFLNLLYSDADLLNLMHYGIEDLHYVVTGDNVIDPMQGSRQTGGTPGYAPGNAWMFGNQLLTYVTPPDSSDIWQRYADFNASATVLKSLGFYFDGADVEQEISNCNEAVRNCLPILETGIGDEPVDSLVERFANDLQAAGVDALIAEEQSQYDAFLAATGH